MCSIHGLLNTWTNSGEVVWRSAFSAEVLTTVALDEPIPVDYAFVDALDSDQVIESALIQQ